MAFGSLFYAQADQTYIDTPDNAFKSYHRVWLVAAVTFSQDCLAVRMAEISPNSEVVDFRYNYL